MEERDKIVTGEFEAVSKGGDPWSEHAIQQAAQMRSIQEQNLEILDCVKEKLENASQPDAQRRSLPEQNLEILDYAKAQQEAIKRDGEIKKITKGKLRVPQSQREMQLIEQRESPHNQVTRDSRLHRGGNEEEGGHAVAGGSQDTA